MKRDLKGKRFADVEDVKKKTTEALKGMTSDEFKKCFEQWKKRFDKCIESMKGIKVMLCKNKYRFFINKFRFFGSPFVYSIIIVSTFTIVSSLSTWKTLTPDSLVIHSLGK
jgi:hypothetical protein